MLLLLLATTCAALAACGGDDEKKTDDPVVPVTPTDPADTTHTDPTPDNTQVRLAGGDISLLPRYEQNGAKYLDRDGNAIGNMLTFFSNQGWNAMRVRLFVDPSKASSEAKGQGVCQDLDYVIALSKRIKQAGFQLMLDFHYSDTWADPASQWTPNAWLSLTDEQLYTKIYEYTADCLQKMNEAGATPDLIQTGNEISYGMLWGQQGSQANRCYIGSTANWSRFANLLKQAGKACREKCPQAKIILHTERAGQASVLLNFYNQIKAAAVDYDIIGLSYYPYYHGTMTTLDNSLTQLESQFADKNIMIVETGCSYHYKVGDTDQGYALSNAGQKQFTQDLIATLRKHDRVKGLFWWFPEANEFGLDWATKRVTNSWYNASLFDNETGRAQDALYELKNFKN